MNFLYCFDKETKEKLILNGFNFIRESEMGGKQAFLFMNNGNHMKFENNKKVFMTDRMCF